MNTSEQTPLGVEAVPGFKILEILSDSGEYIVYRAQREGEDGEVVLKTLRAKYPQKDEIAEIQRDFQIAQRLHADGIIQVHDLIPYGHGTLAIEMEAFGLSLNDFLLNKGGKTLPLDQFFPLAIRLAKILGYMHGKSIVHKDISPKNVLIEPDSGEIRLIDFGISSELSRERQDVALSKRLEGSLPYISPEQTGRMNRDLDYRSDYYSLGVSFFQLLTGRLPFSANDALEWVHCHISLSPPAVHTVNEKIPEALSHIITKLMSKSAEERYQSAYGLIADLERCFEDYNNGTLDQLFELGTSDRSGKFQSPQKLYGREKELTQLEGIFESVSQGEVAFCLVSGYSGVGKSVLVNELGKSIVRQKGYLISGKFDQFQQSEAYMAFAVAFRGLMQQLLGEPNERLARWRARITEALGANAQLIIDLVPELELIIGKQPAVPELSPAEAQNRFQLLFLHFVKVFCSAEHPLVIFMDDLQWSDIPTLNLIHRLVTARELNHFFLIGAYRDNAVDATHPLAVTLGEVKKRRAIAELSLQPLNQVAVDQLLADILCGSAEQAHPLGELIYEKAKGNPFFTIELLKDLYEKEIISFEPTTGHWEWDLEAVKSTQQSDNVVDFLVTSQRRLDASTQQILQLAACIGTRFDLKTLAIIHERSLEQTAKVLLDALQRNLVVPLCESYKFVGLGSSDAWAQPTLDDHADPGELNPVYKFQHDRVQQAAYSLIDAEKKQAVHLSVGRLIQQHSSPEAFEERLIEVVGHLNVGRDLITDPAERRELAHLNLQAGIKAKHSSAYQSALDFLQIAHGLLPDSAWERDYDLVWQLSSELQHCCYLTADHQQADRWTEQILERSQSPMEKAKTLSVRTRQYATIGKMRESISAAYEGLALLGFEMLQAPDSAAVNAEIAAVEKNLAGRSIASLIDAPELTDPEARIASELLMEIFPAAFLSGSGEMFPYLVLKSVNLSLRYGNSPETAFAYTGYGMLLCGVLNDPALGYQYGKLGVAIIEQFDDIALRSRIIYVYTMFIHHWSNHWSSMTPWFLKGIEAGYQSGDLLYLAYSAQDCTIWDPKLNLETASKEQRKYLTIVKDCEYQDSLDSGTLFLQMQLNFQGLTESTFSMTDAHFDEAARVEGMYQRQFMTGIANYHIYKAEIHLLYNDATGALEHVLAQEKLMASVMSLPQLVRFHIVAFLVRSTLLLNMKGDERDAALEKMRGSLAQMIKWQQLCPENTEHLRLMMEAELTAHSERKHDALPIYEQAIAAANGNAFLRDEAMANELAAKFLLRSGLAKASEGYFQAAHYLYYRWGAHRKVERMESLNPHLFKVGAKAQLRSDGSTEEGRTNSFNAEELDMASVLRASQAISGELVLAQLCKITMGVLLENAGAQRGFLIEYNEGQLSIRAQGEAGDDSCAASTLTVGSDFGAIFPLSLINTALRTDEPLVLNNALESNRFGQDPYIVKNQPKSVMCVLLPSSGKLKSVVYMENNLVHGAFTQKRVEVIKFLAAQASISIENAKVYEEQESLLKSQRRFVPSQFLKNLGHDDIVDVELGESVAMDISVMFSDLRDFTPLVERLTPQEIILLLNRYFSQLARPISQAGGFIDSYSGDEIMALFTESPRQAVQAGVEMCRALEAFNHDAAERGQPELKMGIGINTGPVVLGTLGAQNRMQCTVLGDTVNLASRVEQLTKSYGAKFLIGEQTFERVRDSGQFSTRLVDCVAVKGKSQAIKLYEVLDGESAQRRNAKEATKSQLDAAMQAYYARDFTQAYELFIDAKAQDPDDCVLSLFTQRTQRYLKEPPPHDWQGFEKLNKK
uniref:Putative serine/threonine kinase with two-component sensor domain n=1 Tax=Magnetococcus massalia (strain MO-1) TaxID=451514 RepID=A0A1S7LFP2_MAGMO|nr:Putative serine/threonine kinase with two-component sensor domain [Candidatus Magnetococcus massalia]